MKLRVLPAPRHSLWSIFVLEESTGTLFVGDYLLDVEIPNIYFSITQYESSMAQLDPLMDSHQIQRLVPWDGHVADTPMEIRRRIEESRYYIAEVRRTITQHDAAALAALASTFQFPSTQTTRPSSKNWECPCLERRAAFELYTVPSAISTILPVL